MTAVCHSEYHLTLTSDADVDRLIKAATAAFGALEEVLSK
jgi:hypothetical protein